MRVVIITRAAVLAAVLSLSAAGAASAAFSVVSSPNAFSGNNQLNGVSAASASEAWAVGTLCCSARHSGVGTLAEHWNGTTWTIVPSPDTLFNDDQLNAVVDLSATNAWAVGLVKQSGFRSGNPLIVHWDGTSWSTVPSPSGVSGVLRAISADGASDIWAVGDNGHGVGIAFRFTGTSWTSVPLPSGGSGFVLQGVKAFSTSNAWAVGSGPSGTLVLHWNGSSWSVVPSPNPDPDSNILHAIDGASANNVWAVGQLALDETLTGVPPGTRTLTEHWDGARWSAVSSPNTADNDTLQGIAATSSTSAVAIGTDVNTTGAIPIDRTLALQWSGTSWLNQPTPDVGTTDNLLNGAGNIPGAGVAWAVGSRLTTAGLDQTLILRSG